MLIDIHCHAAKPRHPDIVRPTGGRPERPDDLIRKMDEYGIDKGVLLPIVTSEAMATLVTPEEVAEICAMYPNRFIPFCCFDPRGLLNSPGADFRPLLRAYKEMGFKGIGEYLPNIPFDDPLTMNFFAQCEEVGGLPILFHVRNRTNYSYGVVDEVTFPLLERVLQAFPSQVFIGHSAPFWNALGIAYENGHIVCPTCTGKPARLVEMMRGYPNLHGDLSCTIGSSRLSDDLEFGYAFLEEFQDRLYFGTDIFREIWEPGERLVAYFRELKEERLISEEAYEKIAWRNLDRLLGLGSG